MSDFPAPTGPMVSVEEHLERVLAATAALPPIEVGLEEAYGRRLAAPVHARVPIPAWENSAMDGYAVRHVDVAHATPQTPVTLRVVADLPAGSGLDPALAPGECARIMTGAVLPTDADAVVQLEHTDRLDPVAPLAPTVTVLHAPAPGMHVRAAGDDRVVGDLVADAGTLAGGAVLSALSSAGHGTALVRRAPRVTVIATGSELAAPGEALTRGRIPDSNSLLIAGLVRREGCEVVHASVPDEPAALEEALARAGASDVVVLTGGVSAGAYDPVKQVFADSADVSFASVAMQPGKPQAFGRLPGGGLLFGLPGNPVSAWVSFHVFVRPALLRLQGAGEHEVRAAPASATASVGWRTPPGRRQYLPARLALVDGALTVAPVAALGSKSHLVGSLAAANGYAIVPAEVARVEAGDVVQAVLVGADHLL